MMRVLVIVCLLAGVAHAEQNKLRDRNVAIAGFGILVMQIERTSNMGMAVQPTFNRTFDRFELQADLLVADVRDDSMSQPGSNVYRLGVSARYQPARVRVQGDLTLDFVLEAGVGVQYIERDTGDVFGRNDLALGIGLRMLADADTSDRRALMGMEAMLRMLVSPSGDKAFVAVFGVPFGR